MDMKMKFSAIIGTGRDCCGTGKTATIASSAQRIYGRIIKRPEILCYYWYWKRLLRNWNRRLPMEDTKLGVVEAHFADIIWQHEPLTSGELVKLSAQELGWKKSTTYTVLKKLCEKGIFQNQNGRVTSLISKQELHAAQSRKFVEDTFEGSLPAFIAAFASQKALSQEDIAEIRSLIDGFGSRKGE
jgi:predicted transcriptional regulator